MSHAATNWAIAQRGLKPATKIVLWHLCDRHNPDQGCFPSQDRLAEDCEMSRSALNEHLKLLEFTHRIISRDRQVNGRGQQENTRYRFAFESDFKMTQDVVAPSPDSGHGAVSGKQPEPCPEKGDFRVRNPDTNPVREPVREPPVRAGAREGEDFNFDILWRSWPEGSRPDSQEAAAKLFAKLDREQRRVALATVDAYLEAMKRREKPMRMITFLKKRLFVEFHGAPEIDAKGLFIIKSDRPEWGAWLASIRRQYGERSVSVAAAGRILLRENRWPTDLPLASCVTNLAPSTSEMVADSGRLL